MLCAVFRLARYNVLTDDQVPTKMFFGFPTTLTGGLIAIWMLAAPQVRPDDAEPFGGAKLFGDSLQTPLAVWKYFPIALAVGGYLMASRLPMPKVGMTKNKLVSVVLLDPRRHRLHLRLRDALPGDLLLDADHLERDVPDLGPGLGQGARDVPAAAVPEARRRPQSSSARRRTCEDIVLDETRDSKPTVEPKP